MSRDTDLNYYNVPESGEPGRPRVYPGLDCDPRSEDIVPATRDDLLKCSAKHDVEIVDFAAVSDGTHREDGIDLMNECERVVFRRGRVQAGRKGVAITNKGGNRGCTFEDILIVPPYARFVDLEDGNHADQSWRKTAGTDYRRVRRADGAPVRYAWGRAERAGLLEGRYRIVWWWTAVLHLYVYAKHWFKFIP